MSCTYNADRGIIDGQTYNGEFRICWDERQVHVQVGKYGDGEGGHFEISLPNHPSFREALAKWKAAAENTPAAVHGQVGMI